MDRGPLNYYTCGIIKRRICVENVPGVEMLGIIKYVPLRRNVPQLFNGRYVH